MVCKVFEYIHDIVVVVGGEVEPQLQLRDQTIYRLKQEMASLREEKDVTIFTLQKKIKELLSEIEECRSQLPSAQIKTEDGKSFIISTYIMLLNS